MERKEEAKEGGRKGKGKGGVVIAPHLCCLKEEGGKGGSSVDGRAASWGYSGLHSFSLFFLAFTMYASTTRMPPGKEGKGESRSIRATWQTRPIARDREGGGRPIEAV